MKERKKVLMIGPARTVKGGVSAVVNNLYEAGLDVQTGLCYIATMEDGSKLHKLWIAIRALCLFLLTVDKYDIVHVHMASDVSIYRKMIFIRIAYLKKKRIIIHQHGGNIEKFLFHQCSEKARNRVIRVLEKADRLIVIAPYLQKIFKRIMDPEKIILLPNSMFIPKNVDKNYEQAKLLFLGRLCKEKGIRELLEACRDVRAAFPGLQLYMGGTWEDKDLKQLADSLDPSGDWIHQLGWVGPEEKDRLLRECNIFILPSWFEGHPVSLMEGMAYGCACIATDIGGISQMMTNGENGVLIPVKDEGALKEAIDRYLKDSGLQERMGMEAAHKIWEDYNIENNMKKLIRLYSNVYEEKA